MEAFVFTILIGLVLAYGLRQEMERRERIRTRVRLEEERRVAWERANPGHEYRYDPDTGRRVRRSLIRW